MKAAIPDPLILLESLSTGIIRLDPDHTVRHLNPAAEDMLALSGNQAAGRRLADLLPGVPELDGALARAERTQARHMLRELQLQLEPRRRLLLDCCITPLLDSRPGGFLIELFALDRHRQISREAEISAQHHAGRNFIRSLAHEIKNPLGGLHGAAQLLERELTDPALTEYTRVIIKEADRLGLLVDSMLGPNRMQHREKMNVHEVLEHVAHLVQPVLPAGVELRRDYDPSLPLLNLDRDQLTQAVLNLVKNACEAVGEQGLITLRTRPRRQYTVNGRRFRIVVSIDVADSGPGVPAELVDTMFYPLISGNPDGSGLGLAIAQELIRQHDGLVEYNPVAGETVFSILLPWEENHD